MLKYGLALLLAAVLGVGLAVTAYLPRGNRPLLTTDGSWSVRGDFRRVADSLSQKQFTDWTDAVYVVADRFGADGSGTITSIPFQCPP